MYRCIKAKSCKNFNTGHSFQIQGGDDVKVRRRTRSFVNFEYKGIPTQLSCKEFDEYFKPI